MDLIFFLVQKTMLFSIPLLVVALGGMFAERSGIVNIALDGIMIFGAFCSVLFLNFAQDYMSGQSLLLIAILIAGVSGILVEPSDPTALAAGVGDFMSHQESIERQIPDFARRFGWDPYLDALLGALEASPRQAAR